MKSLAADALRCPQVLRAAVLAVAVAVAFLVGYHWPDSSPRLAFFSSSSSSSSRSPAVALSPNANVSFDSSLTPTHATTEAITSRVSPAANARPPRSHLPPPPPAPVPPPPLLPPPPPARLGIVGEDGAMRDDFDIGSDAGANDTDLATDEAVPQEPINEGAGTGARVRVGKFPICPESMREYIPCLDNDEEIKRLPSTERGERFERHCPAKGLSCLVPAPKGYKAPIPWRRSRDEVWFNNVPHTRLVDDKGGQNWITKVKDKFRFPGGGTQFIHGANQYLDQISQMVPDVAFGSHTRVVLDVGCGVASFGAYLLSRDVLTLSIAPKDVHENQIQFALERGVPAMVAAFATHRLSYPSQAFEIIHCSRCRINWTRDDGILLLEVNRLLRAGGYFVWAAQPVYKHEEAQQEAWKEMEDLTARLCWELVKKEGYIAMWRKPLNNTCYMKRDPAVKPPLCDTDDNPDDVWYVNLKACISRLPESGEAATLVQWPARLMEPPKRLQGVEMDAYSSKNELFKAETKFWEDIIDGYIRVFKWRKFKLRNVMDMRAGFGGFAAALIKRKLDCWVMNVVPVSEPNTLPVIYDRGLLGVAHDWCEPFDTYPRTYDMLHAFSLFSKEQKRCNISSILLEMDRILRPGGRAYIRDRKEIIQDIKEITNAMGWRGTIRDTAEGPYASRKVLMCDKPMVR
ncbi:hypothetical protein EJB05_18466, partial [Eragrostis curvula]